MIDKFKHAFLEEARDILVELESALLELNENPGDRELVGRAFRALHTIKGSGAMFGFDELAAFTHNLETAFDAVRNGQLAVTPELINLSLAAMDQIKAMLDEAAGGPSANRGAAEEILKQAGQLTGKSEKPAEAVVAAVPAGQPPAILVTAKGPTHPWRIHFGPGPDMMRSGANPLLLLRELRQLGGLRAVASMAAIPPIAELEPELDKSVIDQLNDPLMHLIRNSMDHGIEPGEARAARGKRPAATIRLSWTRTSSVSSGFRRGPLAVRGSLQGKGADYECYRNH